MNMKREKKTPNYIPDSSDTAGPLVGRWQKKTTGRFGSLRCRRPAMSRLYAADGEEKSMLSGCECRQRALACSPCRPVWSRSHIRNVRRLTVNRILLATCLRARQLLFCRSQDDGKNVAYIA